MNFYRFNCEDKKDTYYLKLLAEYNYFELATGIISFNSEVQASILKGKKSFDFIHLSDGVNLAVSKKVYLILTSNAATGIQFFPIKIQDLNEMYYGVQITGRSGPLSETKKGLIVGYQFDLATWDGSDFFSPQNTGLRFCSERIMKILKDNNSTNVEFTNIAEVHRFV